MRRPVVIFVDDDRVTHLSVEHLHFNEDARGTVTDSAFVPVPVDDQLTRKIDLALDALVEAAIARQAEDEQFDMSRTDAAENERMADAYMEAEAYLRAAFRLG